MEKAYFPMRHYRITQGYGNKSSSHKTILAIDVAGKDTGRDQVFAPFTGIVKKKYEKGKGAKVIWFESADKVLCANGEETYLTMMIAHDDDISNLKEGQIINQGDYLCDEGRSGIASGNHIHIELSNKKFSKSGWSKNKYGKWQINDPVAPDKYLFLSNGQTVIKDNINGDSYKLTLDNGFNYATIKELDKSKIIFNTGLTESEYNSAKENIKNWLNN